MKTLKTIYCLRLRVVQLVAVLIFIYNQDAVAQNFTVNANGDTHATTPTASALDVNGQITLRSACEAATQIAGTHIITIPGSITNINLTLGQITIGSATVGNSITINGPGKTVLTINQTTKNRIFITGSGAITFSLNDLTLNYTGPSGTIGSNGGAIRAGGINANTTLDNVAINNFNIASADGGALMCSADGINNIIIANCEFTNNAAGGTGGAVCVETLSSATIINCKFISNKTTAIGVSGGGAGGALFTNGTGNGGSYNVSRCTFINNQTKNIDFPQLGGAVYNKNGILDISFCRFVGNTANGLSAGQVIAQAGGANVHLTIAQNNWWGKNTGPSASDLKVVAAGGIIVATKWLQLSTTAVANPINTLGSSTVTASFLTNSVGEALSPLNVSTLLGLPISFINPTLGTLSGAQTTIQNSGTATVIFTAGNISGTGSVNAVVDNIPNNDVAPAKVNITISGTPVFTLHLKIYMEGFYSGGSLEAAIDPPGSDTVIVELHNAVAPYNLIETKKGIVKKDGTGDFNFPALVTGTSYYIAVRHRNTITTWSKNPVLFNVPTVNFDFTAP